MASHATQVDAQAEDQVEAKAQELILFDPVGAPVLCKVLGCQIVPRSPHEADCYLTLQLSPPIYQKVDTEALFNLNPELRCPLSQKRSQKAAQKGSQKAAQKSSQQLRSDLDVVIEAKLQPDLFLLLKPELQTSRDLLSLLSRLSQDRLRGERHHLVETESWLGLTVTQPQDPQPRGYRTLWNQINLSELNLDDVTEQVNDRLIDTLSEFAWEQSGLGENLPPEWMAGVQQQISALVKQIMEEPEVPPSQPSQFAKTAKPQKNRRKPELPIELTPDLGQWLQQLMTSAVSLPPEHPQSLLETVTQFLQADGWDFTTIEGESVVRSLFQGKHGQWTCYLWCLEESDRLAIYSVCPMSVPEHKRQDMAEFLTRCNYCLLMGNFEMDFADGEIRFKTSLDVSGNHLTFAWLKPLLHANVLTMDQYLPGIMAILSSEANPAEVLSGLEAG